MLKIKKTKIFDSCCLIKSHIFSDTQISAQFLWGNVFFTSGKSYLTDVQNSNFKIFESAFYLKSWSMPLKYVQRAVEDSHHVP